MRVGADGFFRGVGKLQKEGFDVPGLAAEGVDGICNREGKVIPQHTVCPYNIGRRIVAPDYIEKIDYSL